MSRRTHPSMRPRRRTIGALAIVIAGAASLPAAADQPPLVQSVIIDATPEVLWPYVSQAEYMRRWMAPNLDVDFRVDGRIRACYDPTAELGGPDTIEHRILAFEPGRMLAIRTVRAPEGFPFPEAIRNTWSVIRLEPVDRERTRFIITGLGYGDDAESQAMRGFFEQANPQVLQGLASLFADPQETAGDPVIELLNAMHGDWIMDEVLPRGARLQSWSHMEPGPDGRCVISTNVLGVDGALQPHGATLIWQAPATEGGEVHFVSVNEGGGVAAGLIRRLGERTLRWAWKVTSRAGTVGNFRIDMTLESDDLYRMDLRRAGPDGAWAPMVNGAFRRVATVPEAFQKAWAERP
ncbi:MAG: SRPBCC domain-containing protein [Phycisphaeraceae bacterium]|nr:SRPBCC domain-containing protein [Phycisphaeraceae bacterium]